MCMTIHSVNGCESYELYTLGIDHFNNCNRLEHSFFFCLSKERIKTDNVETNRGQPFHLTLDANYLGWPTKPRFVIGFFISLTQDCNSCIILPCFVYIFLFMTFIMNTPSWFSLTAFRSPDLSGGATNGTARWLIDTKTNQISLLYSFQNGGGWVRPWKKMNLSNHHVFIRK